MIIKDFEKAKRIEKIIDSCETQQQLDNCEKWIYQLNINNEYKSHFIKLLSKKSNNENSINDEEARSDYSH